MKGIFIAYDQAYNMEIADAIEKIGVRGFTMWQDIAGRGGFSGEPHLGNHAWPTMNNAMLTFVPDEKVDEILAKLKSIYPLDDVAVRKLILRATDRQVLTVYAIGPARKISVLKFVNMLDRRDIRVIGSSVVFYL